MTKVQFGKETSKRGEFVRQANRFTDRITADGASGWQAEPGKYRLVVSLACPWAHRAVIVRGLLGLEDAISLAVVDPVRDERGWRFTLDEDDRDPVLGIEYLSEAYLKHGPDVRGPLHGPVDRRRAVRPRGDERLPADHPRPVDRVACTSTSRTPRTCTQKPCAQEIDEVIEPIFRHVNNGVYRCGFAGSQEAYEEAYDGLFAELDRLSARLENQRYLVGDQLTEADIRLFTTLVRFDAAYHGHFKCNRNKLTEMPVLWAYARDLFQTPGFGNTVDFDHIKRHYYYTHEAINPTRIVPKGPDVSTWQEPHGRG